MQLNEHFRNAYDTNKMKLNEIMVDSFNDSLVFLAIPMVQTAHVKTQKKRQPGAWFPPFIPSPWAQRGQTLQVLRRQFFVLGRLGEATTVWELVNMTTHELWFVSMVETQINLFLNDMYLLTLCPIQPVKVKKSWTGIVRYIAICCWEMIAHTHCVYSILLHVRLAAECSETTISVRPGSEIAVVSSPFLKHHQRF